MMHIQLSEIADVFNGKTPSKSEQRDSGLPILKIKDTDIDNRFLGFESFVENEFYEKNKGKVLREGDTLFLNAAHNASHVCSKNYYVPKILEGVIPTGEWLVVRSNDERVDKQYINYYLTSPTGLFYIKNLVKGIHLYPKDVSRLEVPLPSLGTQKKIAEILDKADALRQQDKKIIEKYDQLTQSVFLDMFGDIFINPKGWDVAILESLVKEKNDLVDGPFGSSINTKIDYVEDGEIPVIRTKNVSITNNFIFDDLKFMKREKYQTVKRSQVLPGDIILTKVGTIGNLCIFPDKYPEAVLSTTGSCRIRVDIEQINKIYLMHYLNLYKPRMLEIASTAVQAFLNMKHIKGFDILLPPIDLQNQFAERVDQIENQKQLAQKSLEKSEQLFQSLLQRAFKGELV